MNIKDNPLVRIFTSLFRIKREERALAIVLLLVFLALDALVVCKYYDVFTPLNAHYWHLFISKFHISGFDPITYSVVSDWTAGYNVYRHPLLAFYMYVPYLINQALIWATGINCAIFIVTAIQLFSAFYSAIFLYRICREIVGVSRTDSTLLTFFFFGFAFVMLSSMVPDHFIISMMLLLLALYVSGKLMIRRRKLTVWQSALYFFLTAGTSLNNGLKIYLSNLFVNGFRIFRPKFLFLAILLPAALTWGAARMSYDHIVWPRDMAAKAARAKAKAAKEAKKKAEAAERHRQDSIRIASFTLEQMDSLRRDSVQRDSIAKAKPKPVRRRKNGKPIANGEFIGWTDITTSRSESIVENLLGESIQLHQDNVLGDVLKSRPMIVHYRHWYNYAVEGLIALLFVLGVWAGRRSRFMWLVMSYFALDMVLHIGLGFGINEVYIMSAHWIYAIPIAVAFLLKNVGRRRYQLALKGVLALLAVWLWAWNVTLIVGYLY
ncbi:DUF6080 domain-containing protein [Prevotella sp.]|uniref:DUF6080 domain-containing protein n=1 Tax=Prevotella sp. TaxID=59823 RepID=UPI00307878CE